MCVRYLEVSAWFYPVGWWDSLLANIEEACHAHVHLDNYLSKRTVEIGAKVVDSSGVLLLAKESEEGRKKMTLSFFLPAEY